MEAEQQARARFIEAIHQAEPQRCMVDLEGPCDAKPVRAHYIQKGLLKHLAGALEKKMHALYSHDAASFVDRRPYPDQLLTRKVFPRSAARMPFICEEHEKLFRKIENKGFDFRDLRHTALLAYRVLLAESYIKEWFRQAGVLYGSHRLVASQEEYMRFFNPLKNIVRQAIIDGNYAEIGSKAIEFGTTQSVAASGVAPSFMMDARVYDSVSNAIIPIPSSPMVINILPWQGRQALLLTYAKKNFLDARHFLDRIDYTYGYLSTSKLAKILLEEVEVILISAKGLEFLRPK